MAAIYTEEDRETVKNAIVDLAAGRRVDQVTVAGRTIVYSASAVSVALPQLKQLLAEIDEDLARQDGTRRSRIRRVVSSKGL